VNIGPAAAASGVSAKMLRSYEEIGPVPGAGRTGSGYRVHSGTDAHTLRFIRRARDRGLSVELIRLLVGLWQDRERSSADVKRIAEEHVAELAVKLTELTAMRDSLRDLADACHGDQRPEGPMLRDREGGTSRTVAPLAGGRHGHHVEADQGGRCRTA
jgi:MerR family transcriptional regulator, copper efflux regulator